MGYSIEKSKIINYPPEALLDFQGTLYEYIDNLNFTLDPKDCVENADEYIAVVQKRFLELGWHGDGEIRLMWVPPFLLNQAFQWDTDYNTVGVTIWHVKQKEDGISWLLFPKGMMDPDEIED